MFNSDEVLKFQIILKILFLCIVLSQRYIFYMQYILTM